MKNFLLRSVVFHTEDLSLFSENTDLNRTLREKKIELQGRWDLFEQQKETEKFRSWE